MKETDIRRTLTQVFRKVLRDDSLQLQDEMTGWDSVVYINLVVAIEAAFGIQFSTRDIHNLTNVGEFVHTIGAKLSLTNSA